MEVRNNVLAATNKKQIPWENSSLRRDFYFIRPKIVTQILSVSRNALYLNCGNEMNIQVPELRTYNPSFTAEGASIIVTRKPGFIVVIPNAPKVELTIINNGITVGTETFSVTKIPKPTLGISLRRKPINLKAGHKISELDTLDVKVFADETFALIFPKDARYRIIEWDIILARGTRAVKREMVTEKTFISLIDYREVGMPGDRLVI